MHHEHAWLINENYCRGLSHVQNMIHNNNQFLCLYLQVFMEATQATMVPPYYQHTKASNVCHESELWEAQTQSLSVFNVFLNKLNILRISHSTDNIHCNNGWCIVRSLNNHIIIFMWNTCIMSNYMTWIVIFRHSLSYAWWRQSRSPYMLLFSLKIFNFQLILYSTFIQNHAYMNHGGHQVGLDHISLMNIHPMIINNILEEWDFPWS